MAEGVLFSVAGLLIETLGSPAVKEIALLWDVGDDFAQLQTSLRAIRAVLLDAEKKRALNNQVRLWLERLEDVASDADDLLDQVATEGLLARRCSGLAKKVCSFFLASNQLVLRYKMARGIKRIREALEEIALDSSRFRLEGSVEEAGPGGRARVRESHSFVAEEDVIGRENDKMAIAELLLSPHGGALSVVPIVGMGGLGKTTLAQLVFNDESVRRHFELKFWVCISDNFDERLLVEKIVESVTGTRAKDCTVESLQRILREKISGKRYLLVLDDVWDESYERWQGLKRLLSDSGEESRILVTTRSTMVAKIMGTVRPYNLRILDPEKSWSLFEKVAFNQLNNDKVRDREITKIAEEIVTKCGGVPLAINLIGSLLYFRAQEVGQWQFFQRELSNIIPKEENTVLKTLKLSYDHLPPHLKQCFAYCSLFPKDKEIDIRTLVLLWIAQGFVMSSGRSESLEDIGYEYFLDLSCRSFFQEVERDGMSNALKTGKMHDLVHDLAVQVAGEQYATSRFDEDSVHTKVRHLSLGSYEIPQSSRGAKRLRTVMFSTRTNWSANRIAGEAICEVIFSNFKFLRMLDLSNFGLESLPNSIGTLKHLRYLDLSRNYKLEKLPASTTRLVNLQTLKLNDCSKLRELPRDLENLVSLRHLELYCWKNKVSHMPRGMNRLINLQTLSTFVLSEGSSIGGNLDELARLNKLRGKLEIKGLRSGMITDGANLKEKHGLRSLQLEWLSIPGTSTTNHNLENSLEGLQPHPNLAELSILSYSGARLVNWLSSLTNLVQLRLVGCLKCERFPSLDRLLSLKKICFARCRSLEYIDSSHNYSPTSPPTPTLPSLQELELSELHNFKGWHFTSHITEINDPCAKKTTKFSPLYFPRLAKLTVRYCSNLALMPLYPNVKELELIDANEKPFEQTVAMSASSSQPLSPLSQVKHLLIHFRSETGMQHFPNWMKSLNSLESLDIYWSSELYGYPSFEFNAPRLVWNNDRSDSDMSERDWPAWKCLTGLRHMYCEGLPNLNLLYPALSSFTSLRKLQLRDCDELEITALDSKNQRFGFDSHVDLRTVVFFRVLGLQILPSWLQRVPRLEELQLGQCLNLTVIPDWIGELTLLKRLEIIDCPMLELLPRSIARIGSLCRLVIRDCPKLEYIPELRLR